MQNGPTKADPLACDDPSVAKEQRTLPATLDLRDEPEIAEPSIDDEPAKPGLPDELVPPPGLNVLERHLWLRDRMVDRGIDPSQHPAEAWPFLLRGLPVPGLRDDVGGDPGPVDPGGEHVIDDRGAVGPQETGPRIEPRPPWLLDAADLLAEPDPGPTPWLVDDLIVAQAIVAAVGRWKTTKSYALLDICIAIATGRPAFGHLTVPNPGPVVFINEESGRAALWRRLDALCRGRAIDPEELRGRLHVAANARAKLDDLGWQRELVEIGRELQPRLFVFDPLARMKSPLRKENEQSDMAPLIDFVRQLRDETEAAVAFVHHTGHAGDHMRGSSDLESFWETRITWERDGQSPLVTLKAEHREAESGEPLRYRIVSDGELHTIRFNLDEPSGLPSLDDRILEWLDEHGPSTTDEVRAGVNVRATDVRRTLRASSQAGTVHRAPSQRRDGTGRLITLQLWNLSNQATLSTETRRPEPRTEQDGEGANRDAPSRTVPTPSLEGAEGRRTDGAPDGPQDVPGEHKLEEPEIPWPS